jgi:hypothetical protein
MKWMGWSWLDLQCTPPRVIEEALALMEEVAEESHGGS